MITSDRQLDALVNKGFIVNGPMPDGSDHGGGRTFIVTGLHRSGTSLVSAVLRRVGIFMGSEINDIVHEDEAIAKILMTRNTTALQNLIADRNANYGTWGFKFPMLCQAYGDVPMTLFSDPRVIVTFRDPVSIAVRNSLSEYHQPMRALRSAVDSLANLVAFVDRLDCPSLLLSYEKSLIFPGEFVDAILRFCGLPRSNGLRERLIRVIEPNRQWYITQARRRYDGVIDGVANGYLHGWCRLTGVADPVALDLLVDDRPSQTFFADMFRQDLLDAGFGSGRHGFAVDLGPLRLRPDQVIRVRVATHGIELERSGRRLEAYGG